MRRKINSRSYSKIKQTYKIKSTNLKESNIISTKPVLNKTKNILTLNKINLENNTEEIHE